MPDSTSSDPAPSDFDRKLAHRLTALRLERGWTLETLAGRCDISRATLSRLERGETSPTAALLGRLCAAYGQTMSRLLADLDGEPVLLMPAAAQPVWTDPETGFRRRSVSPPAAGFNGELLEGTLPAGQHIAYPAPPMAGLEHHLWLLEGTLVLTLDTTAYALAVGDCLRWRLFGASRFDCPGPAAARYILSIGRP
jgi:transcriptional regulator with XRE-family HTH domain